MTRIDRTATHIEGEQPLAEQREELLSGKIGPLDTGMVVMMGGSDSPAVMPFAHIEQTPETVKMMDAHLAAFPVGIDVETQWVVIKDMDAEHVFTAVLIVEVPEFDYSFTLFFPFDYKHYAQWLQYAVDSKGMGLIFTGMNQMEMLFCSTEPGILQAALLAYEDGLATE